MRGTGFSVAAGCAFLLLSLAAFVILLTGLLDPVSFKMADDLDPLGPPPPRWGFVLGMFVAAVVSVGGIWLAVRGVRSLLLGSAADRKAEGAVLSDDRPWIVPAMGDGARLLRALPTLFPGGGFVNFEGTTEAEFAAWLGAHTVTEPLKIALGTIWPRSDRYHIPLEPELMEEGAALIDLHGIALPSIHMHIHDGIKVLLQWYDAFCDDPMFVSSEVPRERVEAFARELEVEAVSVSERSI